MTIETSSNPGLSITEIAAGLRQLGLGAGDGVMVHSSLRSLGQVNGGALTVIRALQEVLTPAGTLLMPSFNHGAPFEPGGPGYYDPLQTPTINGAIPDTLWRLPDVRRSLDPTHAIAAWGAQAERYTRHHHRTLTMGPASPLGLLCAEGGYALLLGVGYGSNTFHHVVEMSTGAPCLGLRSEAYPVHLPDGRRVLGRTWGWRERTCPINDPVLYRQEMAELGLQRVGLIGPCRATVYRLQDGYRVIARLLANGLGPYPPCRACPIRPRRVAQTVPSDWDAAKQGLLPDSAARSY
jgi:aminoglycoside 3-N-acetyltransferase